MRILVTVFLLTFAGVDAFAQLPYSVLEGTWRMESQVYVYPDSTVDPGRFLGPSYKILNSTHFAFGRQQIIDGEVQGDVFAGGGRYTLEGNTYTEHIEYHSSDAFVGLSIDFDCRIEGDVWYHSADIGDYVLKEVWHRVR